MWGKKAISLLLVQCLLTVNVQAIPIGIIPTQIISPSITTNTIANISTKQTEFFYIDLIKKWQKWLWQLSTTNYYDASGNLLQTTDALGNNTFYQYDSDGNQTKVTDALNNVTQNTYDALGHLVVASRFIGGVPIATNYTYDSYGNQLTQTQTRTLSNGGTETILSSSTYDSQNRLIASADALGNISTIQYNAIGKQSATTDKKGYLTQYQYDPNGNLIATIHPGGTCETYTYDAENHKLTSCDVAGSTTTYTYDALGRLLRTTNPDNTYTENVYDALGRVSSVVSLAAASPVVTTYAYDAVGNRTLSVDALGNNTTYYYDANNNNTGISDANGNTTQYIYDNLNRRQMTIYFDGSSESVDYDAMGRTISKSDQANNVTKYTYDAFGRLSNVKQYPNGSNGTELVTSNTYDELGNQLTQTDANNHTTTYEYDKLGRRTKRTLPVGQYETCTYDANGNLQIKTDFNGKITTYGYDNMNRLLTVTPDPTLNEPVLGYTYDSAGRRQTMSDVSGITNYRYDIRSRLAVKVTPLGTLSYNYDGNNLSGIYTSHGSSMVYTYDALSRLNAVSDGVNVTTYTYDANSNLAGYTYPNGITTQYAYNNLNRLTKVLSFPSAQIGNPVTSYSYTLGATGNRLSVSELNGRTANYGYDNLYRLTNETINGGTVNGSVGYTYDNVGNRHSRTSSVSGINNQSLNYDSNDRLTSDTYDPNGNTKGSGTNTYAYTFDNRLKSINNGTETYTYDGDGNRVSKTIAGVTTNYLVDNNNPTGNAQVLEESVAGTLKKAYTYGSNLISQKLFDNGTTKNSYYIYDGQGSIRALTDETGTVTDTYTYDAFGNAITKTGTTDNNYQYAGEQLDLNAGFYYLRARYMNPTLGRFFSQDTYEGDQNDPSSLHKYLYCSDNPLNLTDPSGNDFIMNMGAADLSGSPLATQVIDVNAGSVINYAKQQAASEIENEMRQMILFNAFEWQPTPYLTGGNDRQGIDCSHFVRRVLTVVGVNIPSNETANAFARDTVNFKQISKDMLKPADIICFPEKPNGHVGIDIDNNYFIGSQSSTGVAAASFTTGYWGNRNPKIFLRLKIFQ